MPYQLQLPQDLTPEDLVTEVVRRAWSALAGGSIPADVRPELVNRMEAAVDRVLRHRLYAYDTCGLHRSCLDAARPGPWRARRPAGSGLAERHGVTLLHLAAPAGLDEFEEDLGSAILQAAGLGAERSGHYWLLRACVRDAIQAAIGPYLFVGDLCETSPHLREAQVIPVFGRAATS